MKEFAGKKVLIIVENLPVPFDRRVWQEAQSLVRFGCQVYVICPRGKGQLIKHEIIKGVEIFRHPYPIEASELLGYILEYGISLFWELYLTTKIFFTKGIHAIHICNPPDLLFLVAAIFKLFGVKLIFDHHDLMPESYVSMFKRKGIIYRVLLIFEYLTFRIADYTIATNSSYREVAISRGQKSAERVFIVRSGPTLEKFDSYLKFHQDLNSTNFVGYLGVMGKADGMQYLIKAIDIIVNKHGRSDINFIIIGDGIEFMNVRNAIEKGNLTSVIQLTGHIPDKEMIALLLKCTVCVNPDEVNEFNNKSTMNKIIEYMALGKAIVQFENKEGKISAQNASLYAKPNDPVDFAEKIIYLIDNPNVAVSMGLQGRARFEEVLHWGFSEKILKELYSDVFGLKKN